jgi:hypothetical protein
VFSLLLLRPCIVSDCDDYYQRGVRKSGVYIVHPYNSTNSVPIYCEMTESGAWTVIQRRVDQSENFDRNWANYSAGFGRVDGGHWLGNENIYLLTSARNYSLQIRMTDVLGGVWLAEYDSFSVASVEDKYTLFVSGYHGNSTDGLGYGNGMGFSTPDQDNDASSTHCAIHYSSGWWYKHCQFSNLNGRHDLGIVWFNDQWNDWIQLRQTVMRIKAHS